MAEVRNYQVSCLGKLSRSYHADTEQEARDIALSWVRDGRGEEALCFCVQNGQVGPRPFASYRR